MNYPGRGVTGVIGHWFEDPDRSRRRRLCWTDSVGTAAAEDCLTCELGRRRRAGAAPPWDSILTTSGWDVAHAFGTDIEGWCVVVARRHITSLADMTDAEAGQLGLLVRDLSAALVDVVGAVKTYVAQFAEHPDHRHVHFHLIPRPVELAEELKGPGIFARLGLPEGSWVPEPRRNEIAVQIRDRLDVRWSGPRP